MGWKHGFNSPFRSEVYFVRTTQITDLKWGTPKTIMLRDADFGPIRLRAFGTYTLKAVDPRALLTELVGTDGVFEADEVTDLMRSIIGSAFADLLGESQYAALDLAARYRELSDEFVGLMALLRIETVCGLVEKHHGRLVQDGGSQRDAGPVALGAVPCEAIDDRVQAEVGGQLFDA